jgi:choline dehydrogenase-like flavoprotein
MADCDVVVIGSGVAGAIVASVLSARHLKVIVLEAGEIAGDKLTGDRLALFASYAADRQKGLTSPYNSFETPSAPSPGGPIPYYVQAGPEPFQSTYERIVGGSTWHWLGHTPRLLPSDFSIASSYGVGVDWPIAYDDIEPWYCKAEAELGVAGDHDEWNGVHRAFRSRPFPMPKIWTSYSDDRITEALATAPLLGRSVRVLATPAARNSLLYDGRPACAGNASCVPLCPIQAKYDATVHVKKAVDAGAELRQRCVAIGIDADASGTITAVRYKRWDNAEVEKVSGRFVVLAANAIESAKILLMSGLANDSDQVGRNLMDHPQKSAFANAAIPLFPFRGPPSTAGIETFRDGEERRQRAAFRISLDNDGWSRLSDAPRSTAQNLVTTEKIFGSELKARLADATQRQLRVSCSTECLPSPQNRVTLASQVDALGIPRPQLSFSIDDYTKGALRAAMQAMSEIFHAITATDVTLDDNVNTYSGAGHIMGTCRMGSDPRTSVVDANCRAHQHHNLFLAGSSVFPTCGTANPTLTLSALALRCTDLLAAEATAS